METVPEEVSTALRSLVDEYRSRCLWFLAPDYYPASVAEASRVLDAIQKHGDLAAFRRAAEVRQCLSPITSERSAGS